MNLVKVTTWDEGLNYCKEAWLDPNKIKAITTTCNNRAIFHMDDNLQLMTSIFYTDIEATLKKWREEVSNETV